MLTSTGRKSGAQADHAADLPTAREDTWWWPPTAAAIRRARSSPVKDDPIVAVQVRADHHTARVRVATADEKPELWLITSATLLLRAKAVQAHGGPVMRWEEFRADLE